MGRRHSLMSAAIAALWPGGPALRAWRELAEEQDLQGASLAIVGNAGYLAELDQGPLIDGHDIVLRMNNFRLAGYERQVGRKLDIFLTTFHDDVDLTNPALAEARHVATSVPGNVLKRRRAGLKHRHAGFILEGLSRLGRRAGFVPDLAYFLAARERIGRYPSTGAMAILLVVDFLLPVCGDVYVSGFSFFEGQGHYFQPGRVTPRNHDPGREMLLVREVLQPHVAAGRVRVDRPMAEQLGFWGRGRRAA